MTINTGSTSTIGFDYFGDWFKKVINLWAAQWQVWVLQGLIYMGISLLLSIFITSFLAAGVGLILYAILAPGMVRTALKQMRGETISAADIFTETGCFLGALLIGLVSVLGIIGCGIGIFVTGGLTMLALPALVDKKMPVGDAIKMSWDITMKNPFFFIVFYLVLILLSLAGLLGCLIGVIATVAFPFIGMAVAYEEITKVSVPTPTQTQTPIIDTPPPPTDY